MKYVPCFGFLLILLVTIHIKHRLESQPMPDVLYTSTISILASGIILCILVLCGAIIWFHERNKS